MRTLMLILALVALAAPAAQAQGRSSFDEGFYLYNNPEVEDAVRSGRLRDGWQHYRRDGRREHRAPQFDEYFYLRTYPDVERAVRRGEVRSGYDHFQRFGMREGRAGGIGSRAPQGGIRPFWGDDRYSPSGYDEGFYLYNNPDVAEALRRREFRSGREHFERFGAAERRAGSFSEAFYLRAYPDVRRALRNGRVRSAHEHFVRHGMHEGRAGGLGTRYPGWTGGGSGWGWRPERWGRWNDDDGHRDDRYDDRDRDRRDDDHVRRERVLPPAPPAPPLPGLAACDERWYLEHNPDVAEAVRRGQFRSGCEHWERNGRAEGRPGRP